MVVNCSDLTWKETKMVQLVSIHIQKWHKSWNKVKVGIMFIIILSENLYTSDYFSYYFIVMLIEYSFAYHINWDTLHLVIISINNREIFLLRVNIEFINYSVRSIGCYEIYVLNTHENKSRRSNYLGDLIYS